jgi:hypothetical protein
MKFLTFALSLALIACAATSAFDEDLQLATSTAERSAAQGLAVTATKKAILVDGAAVAPIAAGKVDPKLKSGERGYLITPLFEALKRRTILDRKAARRAGKPINTHLTFIFDRAISFRLFVEIVYSSGWAGYDNYDLIVKKASDGSLAAISFALPPLPDAHSVPPALTVWARVNGFKIAIDGRWSELPKLRNGLYDYERLTAEVSELTAPANDVERGAAVLTADESVPIDVVVATMDALRRTRDGTRLFPVIQFAAGME